MHYSPIERAAHRIDLFDVYHDNNSLCATKPKARKAIPAEIFAYATYLAVKCGLHAHEAREIVGGGYVGGFPDAPCTGVTFGEKRRTNLNSYPAEYEYADGSFSVPFPGRNAHRESVTLETLDDAGEVIASQSLPIEPKKCGVIWDRDAVRKAAGPIAKPAKAKRKAPAPHRGNARDAIGEMEQPAPIASPVPAEIAQLVEMVAALTGRLAQMEERLSAIPVETVVAQEATAPSIGELAEPIGEMAPWGGARDLARMRADYATEQRQAERARRLRIVRRYLAMRRDRAAILAQRAAWKARADEWRERAGEGFALRDAVVADAEQLEIRLNAAIAENAKLKSRPHHFGNEVRLDDVRRITEERDVARRSLASVTEQRDRLAKATDKGADMLDAMTERALRAEIALKALEARRDREGAATPYRVNLTGVSFGVAA